MDVKVEVTRVVDGREIPPPGTWIIDPSHSQVEFMVRHMMISKVRGRFRQFDGTIVIAERPEDSRVEVVIEAASIDTRDSTRDERPRSAAVSDRAYRTAFATGCRGQPVATNCRRRRHRTVKVPPEGVSSEEAERVGQRRRLVRRRQPTRTVPASPSTWSIVPSPTAVMAGTLSTAGIPSSRATIAAWLCTAPLSQTTAAAVRKSGVQEGSVIAQTRTSPGSRPRGSFGSRMTRAGPDARPPLTAMPESREPAAGVAGSDSPRRDHVVGSGMLPSNHSGGLRSSR
jgi:YceI-like domain